MKKWLTDKTPFIFTILVGLISWNLIYIVDELVKSPIIEYKVHSRSVRDTIFSKYHFTNISRDINFSISLQFLDTTSNPQNFIYNLYSDFLPPMKLSSVEDSIAHTKKNWILNVSEFQPGCEFEIDLVIIGTNEIPVRMTSKSPLKLMRGSFFTWVLKNELTLASVLLICTILFFIYVQKKYNNHV